MKAGDAVRCIWTQRKSKAYARFGVPAQRGDAGVVTAVTDLRDVTIVTFKSEKGSVHAHIQNLMEAK